MKEAMFARRVTRSHVAKDESDDEHEEIMCEANRVYFYADVSRKNILELYKKLTEAREYCGKANCNTIYLFIQSDGGDAYAGLSAMDHIQQSIIPITTVIDGSVASAATFMALGGHQRLTMTHASILIHQISTGFWGKYEDLVDEMENSRNL